MGKLACATVFLSIALCHGYLKIDHLEAVGNEKFNKVNVTIDNSISEKTLINFHSELTTSKELVRVKLLIVLKMSAGSSAKETLFRCGVEMLRTNVDMCKLANIQSTTFAKVLMENFAHVSNFDMTCPMSPKNYSMEGLSFSDTFLLRFPKEQKLCLELTLSGSLKDKGKLDPLMNFKAWLRIKKSD